MNFTVVENAEVNINFKAFEDEYLHSNILNEDLRVKYSLSKKNFQELTREIKNKYGYSKRPTINGKHYYRHNGGWVISRKQNQKLIYYGNIPLYMGEDVLNKALELCESHNWDIESSKKAIRELKNEEKEKNMQ